MNFLCIIDSKNKILEVRYDGLSYPFKTTQEFYLTLEAEAVKFIMSTLNLKLKSKDLEFLSKNVDQIKQEGFKIVRKKNHFNDEGGATLHSNRKNMLPYVDDLKELLDYKLKQFTIGTIEYQIADELSREIKQFLIEKEEESSCLNIILEIENYRTHFNFLMEKEISCIVQHEYMDTKNDGGRGDYVRSVILQLEEKFNRVGNQRE